MSKQKNTDNIISDNGYSIEQSIAATGVSGEEIILSMMILPVKTSTKTKIQQ